MAPKTEEPSPFQLVSFRLPRSYHRALKIYAAKATKPKPTSINAILMDAMREWCEKHDVDVEAESSDSDDSADLSASRSRTRKSRRRYSGRR